MKTFKIFQICEVDEYPKLHILVQFKLTMDIIRKRVIIFVKACYGYNKLVILAIQAGRYKRSLKSPKCCVKLEGLGHQNKRQTGYRTSYGSCTACVTTGGRFCFCLGFCFWIFWFSMGSLLSVNVLLDCRTLV